MCDIIYGWSPSDLIVTPAWKPHGKMTKSGLPTFYTGEKLCSLLARPYKLIFTTAAIAVVIVTENDSGEEM